MPSIVQHHGERFRFYVQSRTNARSGYLVDLLANKGLGECACKHWQTTIWPRIRNGKVTIEDPDSRCWHIAQARFFLINEILSECAAREEDTQRSQRDMGERLC